MDKQEPTAFQKIIIAFLIILICLLLLVASPILLILLFIGHFNEKQFRYTMRKDFLFPNEGKTFFVYSNRIDNEKYINDNVLCLLRPDIELIELKGKIPCSNFPKEYISHILYRVDEIGFPSLLKIHNGKMYDVSLHKDFYNAKSQNTTGEPLRRIIENALHKLDLKIFGG